MKGNLPIMIPFSRRTSAEWYRLDKDLRGVCGDKSAFVLVVSILCLEYSSLPSRILRGWLAHSAEDGVQIDSSVSEPPNPLKPLDQLPSAIVNLTVNTVTFPAEEFADGRIEPEMSYFFDFQAVLPSIIESNYRQRRVEVPFTLCVIAFAQAKLREAMFKMLLPASDLRRALGSVQYDEFHFADSTRGVNMTDREIVDSRTPTASQQTDDDSDDSDDDNDDNENNDDNDDNSKNDDNGKSDESSGLSLYTASLNGHARVVKLLLENDADVGAADGSRLTALHVSSQKGHIDVVKLLIDSGAETNCTSSYGSTPLNMASGRGHVEVAQLLLDNGADITTANNEGWTPLISASHEGHDGVVKLLLDNPKIDINAEDNIGRTPLFHAAAFGHGEVVQLLLSHKLVVNSKDRYNTTPLFAAARNGHENAVERLLAFEDVDINAKDGLGRTLDWWAIKSGNTGVIELVLQYAEKRGTQIRHTDLSVKGSPVKSGKLSRYCDVCTRRISDGSAYYHCTICNSDDFDICLECSGTGVQCLDSSHKWVLRE
ncbi:ankyrin repeat-containing domain protein [Aspergillus caelatus]|uniref:Ankyrin repeat-containing domain protein n=1 Tax=Aspergillus caelatus TaxID=61420 RepID=A0A5N7A9D9_9EURO|nr:ankyrin repeat-containing domain protein [Aspergillus caelatus]KAE8365200.1 ankyrin repeat-containing domain protein [Aspergillus caelatus]